MDKNYSFIICDFELKDRDFDTFLTYYFNKDGTCKIKGIEKTKSEITESVEKIRLKNEKKKLEVLKDRLKDIQSQIDHDNNLSVDLTKIINEIMRGLDENLTFLDSISIPIKLDVLELDDKTIRKIIMNGYYDTNDQVLGIVNINNDYYDLNPLDEKNDIIKREKLINDVISYKKSSSENKY